MDKLTRRTAAAAAVLACAGLAAAASAQAHEGHKHTMNVAIKFTAVNGSAPVTCASPLTGLGTTSTTGALQDLRFYISNVKLLRANGSSVGLKLGANNAFNLTQGGNRTTLIDLENGTGSCTEGDAATNAVIKGTVPMGEYTGATMYVGVPFPMNHTDTAGAPRPLDLTAMAWSWQAGRKFMKIEVVDPAGAAGSWKAKAFFVHLGSTGCSGNPATGGTASCSVSNRATVRLAKFDPARQQVAVDLSRLFAGNDVTVNKAGAPGCMSGGTDPECQAVFAALGLDWKPDGTGTGQSIDRGAAQTVFRVVPR